LKVIYTGAIFDISGYSVAARNNIMALDTAGVTVEVVPLSFEKFKTSTGKLESRIRNMISRTPTAGVQIIHTVPTMFDKFLSLGKYNIGYTTWETNRLPKHWVHLINQLDEVWVPSKYNLEVFQNSGVTIPVEVIPHPLDRENLEQDVSRDNISGINANDYIFYSIFQWHARKNPLALLKAYLTEFQQHENVCLMLKTYLMDPSNAAEKEQIKTVIQSIKDKLHLESYPRILLISDLLTQSQVNSLHYTANCYVSAHRSEGFGVPICTAMLAGRPVIATDYSGSQEFLSEDTGFPVSCQLTPVYDMPWETYTGDQVWSDINIMDLRAKMRFVFENRHLARNKGLRGQRFVEENLSWSKIGLLMRNRLEVLPT
jgi:glycosyltransferase involved in cell wall biosynthesis